MIRIYTTDIIHSHVRKEDIATIAPCLSYKTHFYRRSKSRGRRVRQEYVKSLINKSGFFPTGLLSRVKKYLKKKDIPYKVVGQAETYPPDSQPKLKGIEFREDQVELIESFTRKGRGIILSPTGTGKTVIVGAVFSCYRRAKRLWLCHTKTLLRQAQSDFKNYGLKKISICSEGEVDLSGDIVLATRQTFINIPIKDVADLFDVVFVDEAHHIPDKDAEYSKILGYLLAPVRGGVTATYPGGRAARLAIEGYVGAVVGEFTLEEAIAKGILAKPDIYILRTPVYTDIKELKTYKEVVDQGIVNNEGRNQLLMLAAKKFIKQGKSVLLIVNMIEHGQNLLDIANEEGLTIPFVYSQTPTEERERLRHRLNKKKLLGAIATAVWKEGVNIPSLDVIILAHIGKKELALLQAVGRGMRTTETKHVFIIVDVFDPSHHYLIKHFGYRLSYYCDRGWLQCLT